MILIAPDRPRRPLYVDIVRMVADVPWRLPMREDLLSQGPILHPALQLLAFNGMTVEGLALRDQGLSDSVISTMLRVRKSSSWKIYHHTWKVYISMCEEMGLASVYIFSFQDPAIFAVGSGSKTCLKHH